MVRSAPPAAPTAPSDATIDPAAAAFERASDGALVERDGTTWTIRVGAGTGAGMHVTRPYALVRQPVGGAATEVAQLEASAWIQTNPTMSGDLEWRFYVAADGRFRAVSRETLRSGDARDAKTTQRYVVLGFDGTKLVPAAP